MRSRLGFYRFLVDLKEPFWELLNIFEQKKRDFVISITKLFVLMIFEWEFGCLGLQKQAFGNGSIAKIKFRRKWISYDSRVDFA